MLRKEQAPIIGVSTLAPPSDYYSYLESKSCLTLVPHYQLFPEARNVKAALDNAEPVTKLFRSEVDVHVHRWKDSIVLGTVQYPLISGAMHPLKLCNLTVHSLSLLTVILTSLPGGDPPAEHTGAIRRRKQNFVQTRGSSKETRTSGLNGSRTMRTDRPSRANASLSMCEAPRISVPCFASWFRAICKLL